MKNLYIEEIARKLGVKAHQVDNCIELFSDGCTIPFIARYRKEKTGGLTDVEVAEIRHWWEVYSEMDKRKETILETIAAQGKLSDALRAQIEACLRSQELEDLYLPFRPKRRTRASAAVEKGLGPLADLMWEVRTAHPLHEAKAYLGPEVPSEEEALSGARDIVAERLAETAGIRENLRAIFRTRRIRSQLTRAGKSSPEAGKYRSYFDFSAPLERIPSHNLLAILRAEGEGLLSVSIDVDPERCAKKMYYDFCQDKGYPAPELAEQIQIAVRDGFKRLLEPSIRAEVIREAKEKADRESIEVFGSNLQQLLLSPPLGEKRIMAIDPGFRTGCKLVCLDEQGQLLHHTVIFPHPPIARKMEAITTVAELVERYRIEAVAIGSGTAGRETEEFVRRVGLDDTVPIFSVSEDGASVYSASDIARKEFPLEDVTVRGAVSIGRRLMDPLSELVKIDPKSLGVGQYQHDVDQALLKEKLDFTVESCVNHVGVNLNTASPYLLQYVSGIGPALSESIVAYRNEHGPFASREALLQVPRLGAKTFQQCAGFLRIKDGLNPLDDSAVHPERYALVDRMAADLGLRARDLVGQEDLCARIDPMAYIDEEVGLPTLRDILAELAKPGLDPREQASVFAFSEEVHELEDLREGMELPGIVTNITAFGAFVDIGLHENGLIHVSNMGPRGTQPSRVVKLKQPVRVRVISVDPERRRIGLRLLQPSH